MEAMRKRIVTFVVFVFLAGAPALRPDDGWLRAAGAAPDAAVVESSFARFWDARNTNAAAKAANEIILAGTSFDEAWARLKRGRAYSASVQRGTRRLKRLTTDGLQANYAIVVPGNYDPARAYQVRVQLHGGIGRATGEAGREGIARIPGSPDQIYVHPTGWAEAMWWFGNQVENMLGILDELKRTYNVDENRVYLTGISDGGTGTYFMGFRETTPWASFLPLNGHMMVLASPQTRADGDMFPGNLVNKPFFIVNGGRDPLYPTSIVEPYINHLRKIGVQVAYRPQPNAAHNTNWWPDEKDNFETFAGAHPRTPLPDRLSWETERTDRYNRAHWLIIDEVGPADGSATLPDTNLMDVEPQFDFGVRVNTRIANGTKLVEVVERSNAADIGLRAGDVMLKIDGKPIRSFRDFDAILQTLPADAPVEFVVERAGRQETLRAPFSPRQVSSQAEAIFPRRKPSGRVDLVRIGNAVEASTRGVRAFTLLLSPDKFDFDRPITVTTNGRVVFEGRIDKNVATLLTWAARDNDRTMLFGAELKIDVAGKQASVVSH